MSETLTGVDGKPLSSRGERTRRRLLEAAETVFAELGYHDASIVKLTEAAGVGQGTFYLYFASKKDIFDELVVDLNHRVRQAMTEGASQGTTRAEMERLGFAAFFRFTAEHPALYRIIRQAEFVSPETLVLHYERLTRPYAVGLEQAMEAGDVAARQALVVELQRLRRDELRLPDDPVERGMLGGEAEEGGKAEALHLCAGRPL